MKEIVEVEDKETAAKEKSVKEATGLRYVRDDLDDNDDNDVGKWRNTKLQNRNKAISNQITGVKKRMAFLDFLMSTCMQEGSKLSEQEVQDEINTIMFEVSFIIISRIQF